MRAGDEDAKSAVERVCGDPRFVRSARVSAASDHGRLDEFTTAYGYPLMWKTVSGIAIIVPIMARVTLKAVNDELARCGHHARLEKASGYFYFFGR